MCEWYELHKKKSSDCKLSKGEMFPIDRKAITTQTTKPQHRQIETITKHTLGAHTHTHTNMKIKRQSVWKLRTGKAKQPTSASRIIE